MKVKVKKINKSAVMPKFAHEGDAGFDLVAVSKKWNKELITFGCGLAFEIPPGYVGLVFPRSSIKKTDMRLSNAVGVIDSGYRGEVMAVFDSLAFEYNSKDYEIGDRFAQMVILELPAVNLELVEELSETTRGIGGYGSTGK